MRKVIRIFSIALSLIVILIAFIATIINYNTSLPAPIINASLDEILTQNISPWTVKSLDLALSQEEAISIERRLNSDDVLFREYSYQDIVILVYVGYWRSGSSPVYRVALHTPDTCWIHNGWTRQSRKYAQKLKSGNRSLLVAEQGEYTIENNYQDVIFWHIVGNTPFHYQQTDSSLTLYDKFVRNIVLPIETAYKFNLKKPADQLFIRVSSNKKFSEIWHDPELVKLFKTFEPLGIFIEDAIDEDVQKKE